MEQMNRMKARALLRRVEKPCRYVGGEWNSLDKRETFFERPPQERLHIAFCFPDLYEIGMSNMALQILYSRLNREEDVWCERAFMPAADMRALIKERDICLESLESGTPLNRFDIVAFSLHYEMCYTAFLDMMALGGLPQLASERDGAAPLVIAGGPIACNFEPIAPFVDVVLYGEGESLLPEVVSLYRDMRSKGCERSDFLLAASRISGVYIPSFYEADYHDDGSFRRLRPLREDIPRVIRQRVVAEMDEAYFPEHPIVPSMEVVHDRMVMEVFRGCARGCRFCQAGYLYRPVRERSPECLADLAEKLMDSTGADEMGLLSLSTSDYSGLQTLTDRLLPCATKRRVSLALPSLRLDSFDFEVMQRASETRRAGLTFAPEAGTQRLRDVINKNIREDHLLRACKTAFCGGWNRIKLYFMMGLPTETDDDIRGIADLTFKVLRVWETLPRAERPKPPLITVSVSFFIPKPWTPFQWAEQITPEEMDRRTMLLASCLRDRRIRFQWHDYETSRIEGVLARGDRRLADVLLDVWRQGAFLDAWNEHFDVTRWDRALARFPGGSRFFTRAYDLEEPLAWDHMDPHVRKSFLRREWHNAHEAVTTPACFERCSNCGAMALDMGICRRWSKGEKGGGSNE